MRISDWSSDVCSSDLLCMSTRARKAAESRPGSLPTREQVMDFITSSDQPTGKREIARAFGLHGAEKIALKALLKDMADEGLIDSAPGRAFQKIGGVPKVPVLRSEEHQSEVQALMR